MANKGFYSMELKGDKALMDALKLLPEKVEKKIRAAGIMAGASPILNAARAAAPKETGLLAKSIKARRPKETRRFVSLVMIGPTHMKRAFRRVVKGKNAGKLRGVGKKALEAKTYGDTIEWRDPGNYGHLVEFGHIGIRPLAKGTETGRKRNRRSVLVAKRALALRIGGDLLFRRSTLSAPPKPFMRPAFLAHAQKSIGLIQKKMWEMIATESRKAKKVA